MRVKVEKEVMQQVTELYCDVCGKRVCRVYWCNGCNRDICEDCIADDVDCCDTTDRYCSDCHNVWLEYRDRLIELRKMDNHFRDEIENRCKLFKNKVKHDGNK